MKKKMIFAAVAVIFAVFSFTGLKADGGELEDPIGPVITCEGADTCWSALDICKLKDCSIWAGYEPVH